MTQPVPDYETLHVSTVARDGLAILIGGPSGSGKSDLALRLIDRGAMLVSDDYTILRRSGDRLLAAAPPSIAGKIEVRGLGVVEFPSTDHVPVALYVDLAAPVDRMPPEGGHVVIAGISIPSMAVAAFESSAAIKVELALARRDEDPS